jgi:integrase
MYDSITAPHTRQKQVSDRTAAATSPTGRGPAIRTRRAVFGPVKDKNNRPRTIPLPDVVLNALVEHVAVYGLGPAGLVFTNDRGLPIRSATFSNMWQTAAGPLGVPKGDGFHQLRHFYASLLIAHGDASRLCRSVWATQAPR